MLSNLVSIKWLKDSRSHSKRSLLDGMEPTYKHHGQIHLTLFFKYPTKYKILDCMLGILLFLPSRPYLKEISLSIAFENSPLIYRLRRL